MHENTSIANQSQSSPVAAANETVHSSPEQLDPDTELTERLPIQLKLSVGAVDDPLEYEADAMADKVMRMPETSFIQRKCSCADRDDEHVRLKPLASQITPFIQAKSDGAGPVSDSVSGRIKSSMGGGSPMQSNTKSFMESRFGTDFSDVKIHNGGESTELNRSLNAKAFTISNNIYFNNGQYQPETDSGKHLLAHELTHVVQQQGGSHNINRTSDQIMLQGHGEHPPAPAPTPEATIRAWLEQNQFAPPASQPPAPDERHVILRGQDMTVGDAVHLVAEEAHQPVDTVRRVINALLARDVPYSARGAAFVGIGNLVPGLPLFPQTPAEYLRLGRAMDLARVDDWLDAHHFYQPSIPSERGEIVVLDGRETTVQHVAVLALASLGSGASVNLEEVTIEVRRRYVPAPGAPGVQAIIGYTFVPGFAQAVAPVDPANPLRNQHQLSFTMTWVRHTSTDAGGEYSAQGSVTLDDSGQVLNVQTGGQAAYVIPLLSNWIQISGFTQFMASANWSRSVTGSATVSPAVQAAVGAQILLTPPSPPLYDHIRMAHRHIAFGVPQIGIQVMGTLQEAIPTSGSWQAPQAGVSGGVLLNIPWDLRF
ncbi:MAG: hypothetical protein JWR09_623 [Mucilaginibacter sp.]|nr:hypothetical protein [Mucilaginibacter sp.]